MRPNGPLKKLAGKSAYLKREGVAMVVDKNKSASFKK